MTSPYWWHRLSYAIRPYDMLLDARIWWWQRGRACRRNRQIGRELAERLRQAGWTP